MRLSRRKRPKAFKERYDDMLFKFSYGGHEFISHRPKMMFPVLDTSEWRVRDPHPFCRSLFQAHMETPIAIFYNGECFTKTPDYTQLF